MEEKNKERRKYYRVQFPCKIIIGAENNYLFSHTENISEGGLKTILEEKIPLSTNVGIELFFEKNKGIKCKGKVVWIREIKNPILNQPTMYETGIEFIEMSDFVRQYIRNLVDKLTQR